MKNLKPFMLLLAVLILTSSSTNNAINHFSIDIRDQNLVFQKVYQADIDKDSMQVRLERLRNTDGSYYSDGVKWKEAGYKRMRTPFAFLDAELTGTFKIEYKANRYRVTVKKLHFRYNTDRPGFSVAGDSSTMKNMFIRRNQWNRQTKHLKVLEQTLDATFSPSVELPPVKEDNW